MTNKNKLKRNKELDYFPSLYMMLDDYPVNKYSGFSMPSLQMNFNSGSFWKTPSSLGLGLNSIYNLGLNNTPKLSMPSSSSNSSGNGLIGNPALAPAYGAAAGMGFDAVDSFLAGGKSSTLGTGAVNAGASLMTAGLSSGNPALMLAGGIAGTAGTIYNTMFGSKMNYENINRIENELNLSQNYNSSATNFDELTLEIMSAPSIGYFSKSDIGSDGLFSNKASRKFRELSARKKFVEDWISRSQMNAATNLQLNLLNDLLMGWFAYGGNLSSNGTEWDNGVTVIGNGGTHELSPYEGVLMGVDPLGIPNLVEEGEVIWNDYVFSNRIPVPNAVRSKYKLRGTKNMTFADAAKKVSKESEEMPNDNITLRGLLDIMSKLAYEQEAIREKRNMKRLNRQYAKGGILGNKGNLFFTGGPYEYGKDLLNRENYNDLDTLYDENSEYMKKRRYMMDNWNTDYVKNYIKNEYIPFVLKYNKSRGYKSNFTVNLDLFTKGTYDNLYGGMHKGVLDFTIPETNRKKLSPTMNIYTTRGRKGGDISINPEALDIYGYSIPLDIIETTKDSEGNTINYLQSLTNNNSKMSNRLKKENKREDKEPPLTSRWFDETVLRYAPVVGSALGLSLGLLSKPNYSRADALALFAQNAGKITPISYDPLGNYLTYRPNDVEYIANKMAALAAATRRGIMNTSGGNRAFALAGLAALDYSSLLALAEAIRQADESNFNRYALAETFNRGTNQYNSEAALKAAMANQEAKLKASQLGLSGYSTAMLMKDAIDALRNASINANLSSLFESLGNIGIDAANRRDRDFYINTVVPNLPIGEYARVYGKSKAKKEAKRRGYNDLEISNLFD